MMKIPTDMQISNDEAYSTKRCTLSILCDDSDDNDWTIGDLKKN